MIDYFKVLLMTQYLDIFMSGKKSGTNGSTFLSKTQALKHKNTTLQTIDWHLPWPKMRIRIIMKMILIGKWLWPYVICVWE